MKCHHIRFRVGAAAQKSVITFPVQSVCRCCLEPKLSCSVVLCFLCFVANRSKCPCDLILTFVLPLILTLCVRMQKCETRDICLASALSSASEGTLAAHVVSAFPSALAVSVSASSNVSIQFIRSNFTRIQVDSSFAYAGVGVPPLVPDLNCVRCFADGIDRVFAFSSQPHYRRFHGRELRLDNVISVADVRAASTNLCFFNAGIH
jgi:hypothetical protein